MLDSLFKLNVNDTNIKKEILAGFTTFITMSYIIFVNPQIMSSTGMDFGAVFVGGLSKYQLNSPDPRISIYLSIDKFLLLDSLHI